MKLRRALPILGVALVIGGIVLWSRKRKAPAPPPEKATLEVQFAGCARVERGPVCFVRDEQLLTLFVPSASGELTLATDRAPLAALERTLVDDGARYSVKVPAGASVLFVDAGNARFELRLATARDPEALARAKELRSDGKPEEAEKLLRTGLEQLPEVERGRREALLARILLARGQRDESERLLRDAASSAERAGRVSDAVEDAMLVAFSQILSSRRFSVARERMAVARRLSKEASGLETARVAYYDALLANATGDRRSALDFFREARDLARRLEIHPLEELVTHQLALCMAEMGRIDEGLSLLRSVFPRIDEDTACNRVVAHTDVAWLLLVGHREDAPPSIRADAEKHLAIAASIAAKGCKDVLRILELHVTKAEWAISVRDVTAAKREVDAMKELAAESIPKLTLWRIDLEARQLLLSGDPASARKLFEREATLADASLDTEAHWRSQLGLGAALARLGQKRGALQAYRTAEGDLDKMLATIPLSEGRDSFAGARDLSARRLVALLLGENQLDEALEVMRWARIRALRSAAQIDRVRELSADQRKRWDEAIGRYREERAKLEAEAQGDWKLASDLLEAVRTRRSSTELRLRGYLNAAYSVIGTEKATSRDLSKPRANELYLVFFPGERGFVALAADENGVSVESIGDVRPDASLADLGTRILVPFATQIRRAQRIRLFTYGRLRSVDLHALPFDGAPLAHRKIVEYALDVQPTPGRAGDGVVIVADPQNDLPSARKETKTLSQALDARAGTKLTTHEGDGATRERFLADVSHARWLHFAGHGTFSDINGADSSLTLRDGRVTVGDILALTGVPELAVLNACDAARENAGSSAESFGVAQAFLVRGAKTVIAPTRPVKDESSLALATALYAELEHTPDAATALGRASARIAKVDPHADWAAYRAFSP